MKLEVPCYKMYRSGPAAYDPYTNMTFLDLDSIRKKHPDNYFNKAILYLHHEFDHRGLVYSHYIMQIGMYNHRCTNNFFDRGWTKGNITEAKIGLFSGHLMNSYIFHYTNNLMEAVSAFLGDLDTELFFDLKQPMNKTKLAFLSLSSYQYRNEDPSVAKRRIISEFEEYTKEYREFKRAILRSSKYTRKYYKLITKINSVINSRILTCLILAFVLNPIPETMGLPFERDVVRERFLKTVKGFLRPSSAKSYSQASLKQFVKFAENFMSGIVIPSNAILEIYQRFEKITKIKATPFWTSNFDIESVLKPNNYSDPRKEHWKIFVNAMPRLRVTKENDNLRGYVLLQAKLINHYLKHDLLTALNPFVLLKNNDQLEFHFNEMIPKRLIKFWIKSWFRTALFNQLIQKKKFDYGLFDIKFVNRNRKLEPVTKLLPKSEIKLLEKMEKHYHEIPLPSEEKTRIHIIKGPKRLN